MLLLLLLMKSWSVQSNNVREKLTKKFWVNLPTFLLIPPSNNESCDPSCASTSNWFLKLLNRSQLLSATECHQLKAKSIFSPKKSVVFLEVEDLYHQRNLFRHWDFDYSHGYKRILGVGCWKLSLKEILTWVIYICFLTWIYLQGCILSECMFARYYLSSFIDPRPIKIQILHSFQHLEMTSLIYFYWHFILQQTRGRHQQEQILLLGNASTWICWSFLFKCSLFLIRHVHASSAES